MTRHLVGLLGGWMRRYTAPLAVAPIAMAPLAVALLLGLAPRAAAQDDGSAGSDPDIDEAVERFRHGAYELAERAFTRILDEEPKNREALRYRAIVRFEMGSFENAKKDAEGVLALDPKEPRMALMLAELLERSGKYEEAIEKAKGAFDSALDRTARMAVSRVLDAMGDEEKAEAAANEVVKRSDDHEPESAREWISLGLAHERTDGLEEASEAYVVAEKSDAARDPLAAQDAIVMLGNLYARVYRQAAGRPNGEKNYKDVFRLNANHRGALFGRYRIGTENFFLSGEITGDCLEKLLEMDPKNPDALVLQARGYVNDRRFDDARKVFDLLLEQNPRLLDAAAEIAALDFLQHRDEAQRKAFEEDRKVRPGQSRFPRILGAHLKSLYRFADAIPFLEEAAKRNPKDGEARTALGECYAHLGREKEAKKILEEAETIEEGWIHPWRSNMIAVLTALEKEYLKVESTNFTLRLHPDDEPILREMLPPFYEATRRDYGDRYGYVPKEKVLVEVFRKWPDFSVRSVGFTGFGALGVCFGPVITSVSPLAQEFRGRFSYLDTAWHEYAHVVHLALSRGRVPRWFTEGLATYEEIKRNPAFDRRMEIDLLQARANDEIYPVMELNSAFRGPRILFGYYQGGLMCEFLAKKTSDARLAEALQLFGQDLPMNEVIQKAFGMSVGDFDRQFLAFVDQKLASIKARPILGAKKMRAAKAAIEANPKDVEALRALAWTYVKGGRAVDGEVILGKLTEVVPNDAEANLIRGEVLLAKNRKDLALPELEKGFAMGAEEFFSRLKVARILEGDQRFDEAKTHYRAAIAAFPTFADEKASPYVRLAKLLADEEKIDEAIALLEEFCKISGTAKGPREELATRYEAKNDTKNLERVLGEILEVDPFQRDFQRRRALALLELQKFEDAARTARLARLVDPNREPPLPPSPANPRGGTKQVDPEEDKASVAECFAIEAAAWLGAKNLEKAREALAESLKLEPSNARALKLKEKLPVGGAR